MSESGDGSIEVRGYEERLANGRGKEGGETNNPPKVSRPPVFFFFFEYITFFLIIFIQSEFKINFQ